MLGLGKKRLLKIFFSLPVQCEPKYSENVLQPKKFIAPTIVVGKSIIIIFFLISNKSFI
jgi:hypothetical protein